LRKPTFAILGIVLAVGSLHATSVAPAAEWVTSFTINLQPGFNDVTNIMMLESGNGYGSSTWAFGVSDFGGAGGTTVLTNPFTSPVRIDSSLLIGITSDLPGDAPGQQHMVLFTNAAFASGVAGVDWGTFFPNTDETVLIADLLLATSGQDWSIIQPGLDGISAFTDPNAAPQPGIVQSGDGSGLYFNTGDPISVVAFSTGQVIGSGSVDSFAPEPGSLATMGLGLGTVAFLLRRRRA
jgi:hypothetical protein